ncbi:surface lipoprotein assembly modifier [Acinetobacter larvae]|uniref:DUF560 domain-containing protein n=1 Tax=Acinetobacter larvae TaxID=1789224 RepID=A0A1B2LXU8_9GAMM|nr:surface lipoprotein assembly modifier [Acinetobacter larvae]AOA57760.1 hypothetical protein BFG52_04900 [Acinetobacter larvae]
MCTISQQTFAVEEDTYLLREQNKLQLQQQEQQIVAEAQFPNEQQASYLTINGQSFAVQDNDADLTRAIFISINRQQWADLERFLLRYRQLQPHAEVVVLFAEGALARAKQDLGLAEQKFKAMLAIDDEFSRGKLELARVLFENKKNKQAEQMFREVYVDMPADIQKSIQLYLEAIQLKDRWRSKVSLGLTYNSNINQKAAGHNECFSVITDQNGNQYCWTRRSEEAVSDWGWNFNLNHNKNFEFKDQQSVFIKSLWYGTLYENERDYNNQTFNLNTGYRFADARHDFAVGPLFEKYIWGGKTLYNGYGARLEYSYVANAKNLLNLQIDVQDNHFNKDALAQYYDGQQYSAYLTWNHSIQQSLIGFANLSYIKKDVNDKANSFDQWGGRVGLYKMFQNNSALSILAMYRHSNYQQANNWIGPQASRNKEQIYFLNYDMPQYTYKGIYPSLSYKYSHLDSNNKWFYDYSAHEVIFKLQKNF